MSADQGLLLDFVCETRDMLDEAENLLVNLQKDISDNSFVLTNCHNGNSHIPEKINSLFRVFHSCKGAASFLELPLIVEVAHKVENLLTLLRSGNLALDSEKLDVILEGIDLLKILANEVGGDACAMSDHVSEWENLRDKLSGIIDGVPEKAQTQETAPTSPTVEVSTQAAGMLELDITADMIKDFAVEAQENFNRLELIAIENEKSPSRENIEEFRRIIHSFKGNCGFVGFGDLETLAHKTETLMEAVTERTTPNMAKRDWDVVLMVIDILRQGVDNAVKLGATNLPKGEVDGLLTLLNEFVMGDRVESGRVGDILIAKGEATPEAVELALAQQNKPLGTIMVEMGLAQPEAVEDALKLQSALKAKTDQKAEQATAQTQAIRVNLNKLDSLINLVGELVIATSMVTQDPEAGNFSVKEFRHSSLHLKRITNELQDVALTMRMVPVADIFKKIARVVYNTAKAANKKIDFTYSGEDTEVDKTIIELLSDPLTHMVRNSIDHGVESPEERIERHKPVAGSVHISARHEGGEVVIEIIDDGRGLDREKILRKAKEKGLVTGDGANMSDSSVYQLIFAPGFSTAEKVTELSGRGVGMDVVRKNIEQIKGRVEIQSTFGRGSTFTMKIPLTLAIIEGLLLRVGESKYTIPLLSIRESFRPRKGMITVTPSGDEVVRVRDELISVIRVAELFPFDDGVSELTEGMLVVVEAENETVAMFVDEMLGQHQTVIKALPGYLKRLRCVSGCTILSDGEVSLIIDVKGLMEKARRDLKGKVDGHAIGHMEGRLFEYGYANAVNGESGAVLTGEALSTREGGASLD